jgi:amidase
VEQETGVDPHPETERLGYLDLASCQALLETGELSSRELTDSLLRRIDAIDRPGPSGSGRPGLSSVIAVDESAIETAQLRDEELRAGRSRGPLHGIPVLIKDNLDTAGPLPTTAGSFALAAPACQPDKDSPAVALLRDAGAVVIGKANLSEWANFRSTTSSSGWSAVGGQCHNPHAFDRSPGGSSSGSAAAVAAGLAPLAVGTETDGSILCPATVCGVAAIKPTVGLVSTVGVVPISSSQDTVGPFARSVADAATLLEVLAARRFGSDPGEQRNGLAGARIGVPRKGCFGNSPWADGAVEKVLEQIAEAGAEIVDPADIDTVEELSESKDELTILLYEFKAGIDSYLAGRPGAVGDCPRSLSELIRFNLENRETELTHFGQELFEQAEATEGLGAAVYLEAKERCRRLAGEQGIDATIERHRLDALIAPTMGPAWLIDHIIGDSGPGGCWSVSAVAGYPSVTVPIGDVFGLPIGICVMGPAWSEPKLIRLALAIEAIVAPAVGAASRPRWLERANPGL